MKKKSKNNPKRPKAGRKAALAVASGSAFIRERRYIVIKIQDAIAYLTPVGRNKLDLLASWCATRRSLDGKPPLECVVVESDWQEYEPTWKAIEDRCTRNPLPQRPHSLIGGKWDVKKAHAKAGYPENR